MANAWRDIPAPDAASAVERHRTGRRPLFLDFNGTLARDGSLLPGVSARLRRLAVSFDITVVTSDTFGTARRALRGLPLDVRIVRTGKGKRPLPRGAIAVGNGNNDRAMFTAAELAIAVIGTEGASAGALRAAAIVVTDIRDALDLIARPARLRATLRP